MSTTQPMQPTSVPIPDKHVGQVEINDDQKDMDVGEAQQCIAQAMNGDKIRELLASKGPTVKAVLLKTDGTAQQVLFDSSPSKNHITAILNAPPSIHGQYDNLDVIVVGPRSEAPEQELALNQHKLRYPFNNATIHGDVFLYRFNQDCVCEDFSLAEYQEFASKLHEDDGKVFKPDVIEDDDEDDADYDEDDQEADDGAFDEAYMRQIIASQIKRDYPKQFGRDPTEDEIEQFVNATLAVFGGVVNADDDDEEEEEEEDDAEDAAEDAQGNDDDVEDEDDEDDDEEYDPAAEEENQQAMRDEIEDRVDDEQFAIERKDIEQSVSESNAPLRDVSAEDEKNMLNSAEFEDELRAAIANVQQIAKIDKQQLLAMTKELYVNDTGVEPTEEMLAAAFQLFSLNQDGDADDGDVGDEQEEAGEEEEEDAVDPAEFAQEMESALENVRNLGRQHRGEFVQQISNTFAELNGEEPSQPQIDAILGRIQQKFEEEAMHEFLDNVEEENEAEADADYAPNEEDREQLDDDQKEDVLQEELVAQAEDQDESSENDEEEEQQPTTAAVKVLVTPMKKARAGARVDIYLDEQQQQDSTKKLECASAKFVKIEKKMPNEDDTQRLKNFLDTGMLFESEIEACAQVADGDDKADYMRLMAVGNTQNEEDDDEEDGDYEPAKDTFDYSKDIEDDESDDDDACAQEVANGGDKANYIQLMAVDNTQNEEDDDEEDADYDPAKDTCDYSKDIEDDENVVSDDDDADAAADDENDDTSNMVDID